MGTTNADDDKEDVSGLSGGGIAGIVVGATVAVVLSIAVLFLVTRSKHLTSSLLSTSEPNSQLDSKDDDTTEHGVVNPLSSFPNDEYDV